MESTSLILKLSTDNTITGIIEHKNNSVWHYRTDPELGKNKIY